MDALHHLGDRPRTGSTAVAAAYATPWWREKWWYLFALFAGSKAIWTVIGLLCVPALYPVSQAIFTDPSLADLRTNAINTTSVEHYNAFTMWFRWDSFQYVRMVEFPFWRPLDPVDFECLAAARRGERFLPTFSLGRFAWAPLLIWLGKGATVLTGGKAGVGLFLVANLAFFGCLVYAYLLGEHLFGTPQGGRRSALFLCLLPTGFLLQAVLSEGLFVCLLMASMYYVSKRRWLLAGLAAVALGLTRSTGFLMALPLALLVAQQCRWRLASRETWLTGLKALPAIVGAPVGWAIFLGYSKFMTGSWDAYTLVQAGGWGVYPASPLEAVAAVINPLAYTHRATLLAVVVATVVVLVLCAIRLPLAYPVAGLLVVLAAMSIGADRWGYSVMRYLATVFAPALLAAWATIRWKSVQVPLVCALSAAQSGLFLLWTMDWLRAII